MTPSEQQTRERIGDVVLLDMSEDAHDAARDAADKRLTTELQEGGRFRRFVKSIWKGSIAKDYYRQRYIREAHQNIVESQDVLSQSGADAQARGRAMHSTIDRFQSVHDEMIHTAAGEQRSTLNESSDLVRETKQLVRQFAEGRLNHNSLNEEFTRLISVYREQGGTELRGSGEVQLNNVIEVAQQVKAAVEHGESIDAVMEEFGVKTGETRTGVRTQAKYDKVEKIINKIKSSRIGSMIPHEAVIAGVSIAASALRFGSQKAIYAAGATLGMGVGAAGMSALRERKRVKDERVQHAREMAQGGVIENGSKRRQQMEATRYATVSARELASELSGLVDDEVLEQRGDDALREALNQLAQAEALIHMSDQQGMDLLSYSDVSSVAEERFDLDLARAQAKVALRGRMSPEKIRELGYGGRDFEQVLAAFSEVHASGVESDMTDKDAAFKKLRRRRMAGAAAVGGTVGVVLGIAGQELGAMLSDTRAGIVESLWDAHNEPYSGDGMIHNTVLNGLVNGDTTTTVIHHDPSSVYQEYTSNGVKLHLPDDYQFVDNQNGTADIIDPNGDTVATNLSVDDLNNNPQAAIDALKADGVVVDTLTTTTASTSNVDIHDYIGSDSDETVEVHRVGWYENNTPAPVYDKNEQGMWWGGENNSGITKDGDYEFDISHMTATGSYQGSESVDWSKVAADGKIKLALSATKDTQSQVFLVDVGPDGKMLVPKDSPAAALFATEDGHAIFKGAYAETAHVVGGQDGVLQIRPLATVVGENNPGQIPITTEEAHPEFKLTPEGYDTEQTDAMFTEVAPVIPIAPRRSMETLRDRQQVSPQDVDPFTYAYGGGRTLEDLRRWVKSGDYLRPRRQVEVNGESRWVEQDGSPVERSVDRERDATQQYLNSEYQKQPDYEAYIRQIADSLGPMEDECRVAVNIPAWMEEKNLPGLLESYIDQRDNQGNPLDPSLFEINIIINRQEGTQSDGSVAAVEDFIRRYAASHGGSRPKVHYVDVEFTPEHANVGYARKVITDATLLRSLDRQNQSGALYMESEDADLLEVDKRVITNLISKLDKNPHLDAVRGMEGRMPSVMKDNDFLLMRRNAWEMFLLLARQKKFRDPRSPSWNNFANRIITGGWNAGYSAEAYAMIGGYEVVTAGEDISIGERITMSRGDGDFPNLETIGSVPTRSESSPRRFINEIITKKNAYADFGTGPDEEKIRGLDLPSLMSEISDFARITPDNERSFERDAQMFYDWCKSATPTRRDAQDMTKRILLSVGLKPGDYRFAGNNSLKVTNWGNVKRSLSDYRRQFNVAQRPNRKMMLGGWKRPELVTNVRT